MSRIKNFFDKILGMVTPTIDEGESEPNTVTTSPSTPDESIDKTPESPLNDNEEINFGDDELTNNALCQRLCNVFERELKRLSVGRKIIFVMNFTVILNPNDWANIGESLKIAGSEFVEKFYAIISKYENEHTTKIISPSTQWEFRFAKYDNDIDANGQKILAPEPGEAHIITKFLADRLGTPSDQAQPNIKLSVSAKNSKITKNININEECLKDVQIIGDVITIPFKYGTNTTNTNSGSEDGKKSSEPRHDKTLEIKYELNGYTYTYEVNVDNLIITNAADSLVGDNVLKIDNPKVKNYHAVIKWDEFIEEYTIAVFATATFNERDLMPSTKDKPVFYPIKSEISELDLGFFTLELKRTEVKK